MRLRRKDGRTILTYKEVRERAIDGSHEIEVEVSDFEKAEKILEYAGLIPARHQEKRRHTFILKDVAIDIDTWPQIPTYIEIEGPSEKQVKEVAKLLELNWKDAIFKDAAYIIEEEYNIPVREMKYFTFDRFE